MLSPVALQAQNFRSCLCADEMDAPILGPSRDDVASGPILHALNARVKARRVPSARGIAGQGLAKPSRTCCRARLHGKQRSGTHTASCGGGRPRAMPPPPCACASRAECTFVAAPAARSQESAGARCWRQFALLLAYGRMHHRRPVSPASCPRSQRAMSAQQRRQRPRRTRAVETREAFASRSRARLSQPG